MPASRIVTGFTSLSHAAPAALADADLRRAASHRGCPRRWRCAHRDHQQDAAEGVQVHRLNCHILSLLTCDIGLVSSTCSKCRRRQGASLSLWRSPWHKHESQSRLQVYIGQSLMLMALQYVRSTFGLTFRYVRYGAMDPHDKLCLDCITSGGNQGS